MTFAQPPTRPGRPQPPRERRGPLIPTVIVLAALVVLLLIAANVWTEFLWFQQLGYIEVIRTEWGSRLVLFLLGFLVMGGTVFASLRFAYRSRPVYAPSTQEQANLDQYREAIEPLRRVVMIAAPAVLGLFAGGAASQQWATIQLWMNSVTVGKVDPQYGLDLSFYLFTLPGLRFIVSFLMAVVILAGIAGIATQYLYGGLRIGGGVQGPRTTRAARIQVSVTGAALMLLIAANYWLDRYSVLTREGDKFEGASFTDVNAVIPAKGILAGVAVFVAILFIVTAVRGTWRLPAIGVGLMVVSAIAVGGVYPAIVQRFQVTPNQQDAEAEFIQRNIDATLDAFGLDGVETAEYDAEVTAEKGALRSDADTTASIRLLDPQIVSPSFKQLQQNKGYYSFADTLSVDRYTINNESRDTVIAVRELELSGINDAQRNWINDHTVYTHGFGVVAAYGNTTGARGAPAFWEGGIPSSGEMGEYEERIYFSPKSPSYSIVGSPDNQEWELDYPDDSAPGGQVNTSFPTHEVEAGPSIGTPLNQLLYAIKFGSEQIVFSDRVTDESQILYDRDPRTRVEKVAPYLTLDGRVYPAVVDNRVVWIVDGYTTSDQYPYAASRSLEDATTDSLTARSASIEALEPAKVNYIRNSVKATVDAYDGSVKLYAWDTEDPVLQAWNKVFPTSLSSVEDISSELMSHIRYPEDLFKVQRNLLTRYHVQDATQFFSGGDFWANPNDPTLGDQQVAQPPYYLTLKMPDQDAATFSLMSTFIPAGTNQRNVLTGFLAVDAEAGTEAGKVAEGYGKLRLLELPRDSTVPGPGQVNNNFSADPTVSQQLNLLQQANSAVVRGNLLTLPVGGGLLYVQPVYVQSSSGTQFPLLQRVLVAFGDQIGFAPTLDEALDQVFGGDSGTNAGDVGTDPEAGVEQPAPEDGATDAPTSEPTASPTPEPTDAPTGDARAALDKALSDASQAMKDGQTALAAGDFAAYGEAQKRLDTALAAAIAAEEQLDAG
ncbi:UPF0182 family membrane protein [Cellulomonas chengniuliangii]|uniref:UPF0182 family membrane protein n=1 Tax=Cellulomonas chengniuliangii TaxID=2968084 RepID=UPI001D0EE3C9|nr:UPF0182 family protein [Cellulomonas chengniuliangii]MCC2319079.1 UPF0182 family protein [Cellulomonas chengniuliangii]